jgi:hypothetical protein
VNATEFYSIEHAMLREELKSFKKCQIEFLIFAITGTGILLGLPLFPASNTSLPLVGAFYLIPLAILLPFWWIFFDKATSITRVVGYSRIVEKLILGQGSVTKFVGWENALATFRQQQQAAKLKFVTEDRDSFLKRFLKLTLLGTTHRYWTLTYYIFFSMSVLSLSLAIYSVPAKPGLMWLLSAASGLLSSISIITSWRLRWKALLSVLSLVLLGVSFWIAQPINDIAPVLIDIAIFLLTISTLWNLKVVWELVWGRASYEGNWSFWKQILEFSDFIGQNEP